MNDLKYAHLSNNQLLRFFELVITFELEHLIEDLEWEIKRRLPDPPAQ